MKAPLITAGPFLLFSEPQLINVPPATAAAANDEFLRKFLL